MKPSAIQRKHGLQRPFYPLQIFSWFSCIYNNLIYIVFIIPEHSLPDIITLSSIYATLLFLLILLGYKVSRSDPTDPVTIAYKKEKDQGILQDYEEKSERYCSICNCPVYKTSKHCMRCNRCTIGFDHHCKWVNNCIGVKNYKEFFAFIVVVQFIHVLMTIDIAFIGTQMILNESSMISGYKKAGKEFFYFQEALIMIALVLCTLAATFITKLVFFHVYISIKGITTYQYILSTMKNVEEKNSGNLSENRLVKDEGLDKDKKVSEVKDCNVPENSLNQTMALKINVSV
ncbi:hypothetical protein SteCoe_18194 [Stentor coeruleus]|uniref:Palmitoyltransferase n=1 Tax=Stentor coeruleus TaxID=5963 RepID=A0A1R2BX16_9CILI|nr:hypothetical protein SteCoe_18194 [Stentor coeruleus]